MANLDWGQRRNIENSVTDFLQSEIASQNLTILDEYGVEKTPQIRVGFQVEDDWEIPMISLYMESKLAPRLSIGSNLRENSYLMIIDVRASNVGGQLDLTDWVTETINDGFDYNEWSPNPGDPNNPTKVKTGRVSIDFISNTPVRFGENVNIFDKYRQNITISVTVNSIC